MNTEKLFKTPTYFSNEMGAYLLFHFRAVGIVLIGYNVYSLTQGMSILAFILIGIGIAMFFSKERLEVNLAEMEYREAFDLFGFVSGKWQELPKVDYVSIFPTHLKQNVGSAVTVVQNSISYKDVRLNLVYRKNKRLHVFTSKNMDDMKKLAFLFADQMDVGVYDCTGADNVWLKPR
jgi:hypothetical protein